MRHAEKKPQKNVQKKFISVKPHCPLSIWESTTHRSLSFFLNKMRFRNTFCYKSMESFQIGFLFLINFRRFKWGIKERFQLLTLPCILIFKEILLRLRALNGDNMVYILQCCYCSFMMYIIYMSSDLQHSVWWNKYRLLKCLVFIYLHHIKINKTINCNAFIRKKNHKNEHLEDIHIHSRVPYSFFGENIKSQIFITGTFWLKC